MTYNATVISKSIIRNISVSAVENTPYGPDEYTLREKWTLKFWSDGNVTLDKVITRNGIQVFDLSCGGENAMRELEELAAQGREQTEAALAEEKSRIQLAGKMLSLVFNAIAAQYVADTVDHPGVNRMDLWVVLQTCDDPEWLCNKILGFGAAKAQGAAFSAVMSAVAEWDTACMESQHVNDARLSAWITQGNYARLTDNGPVYGSQYTNIQILMALDIWTAARQDLDWALDDIDAQVAPVLERSQAEIALMGKITRLIEGLDDSCPLGMHRWTTPRYTRERYPVDKTLKSAAKIRNVTAKVRKVAAF